MMPEKYPATYLKTEPFDIRYKIVAEYFARNGIATEGKVIIDLNCGEPRFKNHILYKKYYANDVYIPDDVSGIEFSQITDEQVDIRADILCCFGYGGGEFTHHPLESKTAGKSICRLAKYNPEYIIFEMAQKWENDFHIISDLIKNLPDYSKVFEEKYQIEPADHYHNIRQLVILKFRNLENEFQKLSPWICQFIIDGKKYGGNISHENDTRINQFFNCFPDVKSILELGSLEGAHTFQLAKQPGSHIFSIEGRLYNIDKAKFVQQLLGIQNVTFACMNLENIDLSTLGKFDAVFCSGILYHLPEPWKLIKEISKISTKLYLWTHYAIEDKVTDTINGYRGLWYQEGGLVTPTIDQVFKDPLSGLSQKSFWVTIPSLKDMLHQNGFNNIKIIDDNPNHPHGACITLCVDGG